MSTDDDLDARLHEAGRRWRAANTTVAAVDLAAATEPAIADDEPITEVPLVHAAPRTHRRGARLWIASIAGAAAAIAAGLVIVHVAETPSGTSQPAAAGGDVKTLLSTTWTLDHGAFGSSSRVFPTRTQTLRFSGGMLVGYDGVNTFGAPVTVSGHTLRIGTLSEGTIGTTATAYVERLDPTRILNEGKVNWSITGDTLTIIEPGVGSLVYTAKTNPPTALIGRTWSLTSIERDTGANTDTERPSAALSFSVDSHGTALSGGCDSSTARVAAGRMVFTQPWAATFGRGCQTLVGDEAQFVYGKVLTGTVGWLITGNRLTITQGGVGALVFQRKDVDPGFTGSSSSPGPPSATSTG